MGVLKRFTTIVGAAALVLAVYFSGPGTPAHEDEPAQLPAELAEEPDVYLNNATISEFETTGVRKYQLHASRMDRFEDENLTRLVQPALNLSNPDAAPWDIRADRGVITRPSGEITSIAGQPMPIDEDIVVLHDNVELKQFDHSSIASTPPRLTIRSAELTVHPHQQYAETDQDVMIDTAVGRTVASGMQGDLRQGLLFLKSDQTQKVHTIVLPQQFKEQ